MVPRRTAIAVLAVCMAMPLAAQFAERIDVIAVEVPITVRDRSGQVPEDLTAADFEVFEDGVRQEVIGLSYPLSVVSGSAQGTSDNGQRTNGQRPRWQIVIYVQESMSSTQGLRIGLRGLLAEVDRLAAMGDVEIVSDFPAPHVLLSPTSDANVLRSKLDELQRRIVGREEQQRIRQQFIQMVRRAPMGTQQKIIAAQISAAAEAALVRRRQDAMLAWMARYGEARAGATRFLVFVSDGYSLEPFNFYVTDKNELSAGDYAELRAMTSAPRQAELARTVAAHGWAIFSVAPRAIASATGVSVTEMTYKEILQRTSPNLADTLASMFMFNDETGGQLTTDVTRIPGVIESFTQRLTLTYQARRRRDGELHDLEIKSKRRGLTIESQHAVMSATAEAVVTARATSLALQFGERGELPVTCRIRRDDAGESLDATVDLAPLGAARASMNAATLRVAIGVTPERKQPFDVVQRFEGIDLSAITGWQVSIPIRNRLRAPTAVVVEEVSTGIWGGARCE